MADYVPIPLQAKAPDGMSQLSSLLGSAQAIQNYNLGKDTYDAKVLNANSTASSAQSKATVDAANVQPLIAQQAAQTSQQQTAAESAQFKLHSDYADTARRIAGGLSQDPRMQPSPNYDPAKAADAISEATEAMQTNGVPKAMAQMAAAPLMMKIHDPVAAQQALKGVIMSGMSPQGQSAAINPNTAFVQTNQGTQPYNTNTMAMGSPVGAVGPAMAPPNQIVTTPTGRMGAVNPATGSFNEPQSAAPVNLPVGETTETQSALQGQRDNARQVALAAPQMHDINKTIVQEANNLKDGGTLAQLTQKLSSATGFNVGNESATGYNLLGKMLERSALTAAQSQGPHTNAGLEAVKAANGTLDYTPDSLKTIARLNDALTTGSEKYQSGLEAAIANNPNVGVFAKRKFDQQWGQNADVNALKFLTATKNGDQEAAQQVLKAVGGPGSAGAKDLATKLQNLQSLTTKGSL